MNVLVIPEDFRKDQYILKPIVERLVAPIASRARVRVCQDPLLGGVAEALRWERIEEIVDRYRGMVQLFLLVVDRDGNQHRRDALDNLEQHAQGTLGGTDRVFLAENAWQEVEVWVLAGQKDLPSDWRWADIRAEPNPKERFFDPYVAMRGLTNAPYAGRSVLAAEAAGRYPRIRQLCPEDIGSLEQRVKMFISKGVG